FGNVKNVPDRDYQALAASFDQGYVRLATILEDIVKLKDPKGADKAQYDALVSQRTEAIEDLSAISSDFSSDVRDHRNAVSVTDVSDALEAYLEAKNRVF